MPDYHRARDAEYNEQVANEPRERESALGDGCCQMCGEPYGMVLRDDGTERLGCLCIAKPEQMRVEIERLVRVERSLIVELATAQKALAEFGWARAEDRPTDGEE